MDKEEIKKLIEQEKKRSLSLLSLQNGIRFLQNTCRSKSTFI